MFHLHYKRLAHTFKTLKSQLEETQKASEVTFNLMKAGVEIGRQRAEKITALERKIVGLKARLKTLTEENQ